ncbi:hypothetical protein ACPXCP_31330 [Streptomyces sp. DT20]|uniref:hypothetical protein n=1 Tax=Streptomyces sp. DT20 TaxID=3416519 RepID=UPI003CF06169
MRAAARRLRTRLGRRGQWLILWAVAWICWGYGVVAAPIPDPAPFRLLTTAAPLHDWAWVWIGAGIIVAGCSLLRPPWDWPGFIVALVPPLTWAMSYFVAGALGDYARGPWAGLLWLALAAAVMQSSRTREHSVPHSRKTGGT